MKKKNETHSSEPLTDPYESTKDRCQFCGHEHLFGFICHQCRLWNCSDN